MSGTSSARATADARGHSENACSVKSTQKALCRRPRRAALCATTAAPKQPSFTLIDIGGNVVPYAVANVIDTQTAAGMTSEVTVTAQTWGKGSPLWTWVAETVAGSNVWNIQLKDVTTGQSFSTTAPYSSTHATAEWIEETPLVFGTGGAGLAALPNLTNTPFTSGTTNGANANLKATEEIQLIDSSGKVIGTPSAPNSTANGFSACAWATSC